MATENRKLFDKNLYIFNSLSARLGSGTFGSVYRGVFIGKGSQEFPAAIKIFNNRSIQENKELEGAILQGLEHPNIVKVYQTGMHDKEGYYIAMELCETTLKGFLHKHGIRRFSEREARSFFIEICNGVKYLQSKNIIHRDIKFENILIDSSNNLKLADFGLAKLIDESLTQTTCGSTHIMAPEIFKRQPYGKPSDVWSLGVVLYGMLTGDECIYKNVNRAEYEERMKNFKQMVFSQDSDLSAEAKDLISLILNPDPTKRPTVEEILNHPWMNVGKDDDIYTSNYFLNNYTQAATSETTLAGEVAAQVSRDILAAVTKSINSIFSNMVKIHEVSEWFKTFSTDALSFEEAYLYISIRILIILNKLESLEYMGTNQVSQKISIIRLFEGVKKTLFPDLKSKLVQEIERLNEKLDMKSRPPNDFEENFIQCLFATTDSIVSKDMSKAIPSKDLKKLYQACLMGFALASKDYDQFICDVKTNSEGLSNFAARHKLELDTFKAKAEAFINQVQISSDQTEGAQVLNVSEMKGLYDISFRITSLRKSYLDKYEKAFKEVESRIEKRIRELK